VSWKGTGNIWEQKSTEMIEHVANEDHSRPGNRKNLGLWPGKQGSRERKT
jgi:hypothetical protein